MSSKNKIVVRDDSEVDLSRSTPKPELKKPERLVSTEGTAAPKGGGDDVLQATAEVFGGLHRHNVEQAQGLGRELAEAEQKIPLHLVEAYQARKKELEEDGLDAKTFLSQLTQGVDAARGKTYSLGIENIGTMGG